MLPAWNVRRKATNFPRIVYNIDSTGKVDFATNVWLCVYVRINISLYLPTDSIMRWFGRGLKTAFNHAGVRGHLLFQA